MSTMERYIDYLLTSHQLNKLINSDRCCKVFKALDEPIVYYDSLEKLAKKLKYKNRSGLWKALKELEYLRLIQFVPDKKKIINLVARISFEEYKC